MNLPDELKFELQPESKPTVMELVKRAGLDVASWQEFSKGAAYAASNPRYCYEWCFQQNDLFVLNIWYENMLHDERGVYQVLDPLTNPNNQTATRKRRARDFLQVARNALKADCAVRAIILDRPKQGVGSATARMLDNTPWRVVSINEQGDFILRRGVYDTESELDTFEDPEVLQFKEGEKRRAFVNTRKREWQYRDKKIQQFKQSYGRVFCEVPGCGFDFETAYGELGRDFAEVHHLNPLKNSPDEGRVVTLSELAVVCANCHRMIHRGGQCRELSEVSPKGAANV